VIAPVFQIPVSRIDGNPTTLAEYQGSALLISNLALACGLTRRYVGLEPVYAKFCIVVLGFPDSDFAGQMRASMRKSSRFCETKYRVRSALFERITLKSQGSRPTVPPSDRGTAESQFKAGRSFRSRLELSGVGPEHDSDVS
jgi:glutathione peroxidase